MMTTAPWITNEGRLPDGRPAPVGIIEHWQARTTRWGVQDSPLILAAKLAGLIQTGPKTTHDAEWWLGTWRVLVPDLTWDRVAQDLREFVAEQQSGLPEKVVLFRGIASNRKSGEYVSRLPIESWTTDRKVARAYAKLAVEDGYGRYARVVKKEFPRDQILAWEIPGRFGHHREVVVAE